MPRAWAECVVFFLPFMMMPSLLSAFVVGFLTTRVQRGFLEEELAAACGSNDDAGERTQHQFANMQRAVGSSRRSSSN